MSNNSLEIVHEGWLIKSPPRKPIWRARWRRRWFVLRHSGELPGQYFLEYYTDRNCRKLKGKIDLDQCDQVDAGLKFEKYPYLFDVRTPKRIFYLAAESEKDMNKWVDCVCHVCGLKAYSHEDEYYDFMPPARELQGEGPAMTNHHDSSAVNDETSSLPRVSASNTPSSLFGPYIPISECISGRPLNGNGLVQLKLNGDALNSETSHTLHRNNIPRWSKERNGPHTLPRPCSSSLSSRSVSQAPLDLPGEFYDQPRRLHPPNLEGLDQHSGIGTPPLHSPATTAGGTDGESVNLTEEEDWGGNGHLANSLTGIHGPPSVNWNTYPKDGEAPSMVDARERAMAMDSVVLKFARRYGKMSIADDNTDRLPLPVAPPRPPKPLHLMEANKHSYLNLDSISPKYPSEAMESVRSSDGEPSPGVILRQNNSNPSSPGQATGMVLISDETYDFPRSHQMGESSREPRHQYSNAAPGRMNDVFRYDFHNEERRELDDVVVAVEEPTSPRSESSSLASSTVIYSNLPSPLCGPGQVSSEGLSGDGNQGTSSAPPIVNRDLKPGRKASDSTSHDLSPGVYPVPHIVPPTVDRTLKPHKKVQDVPLMDSGPIKLASPPACRTSSDNRSLRKLRAAPSPTPPASAPSTLRGVRCQSANSIPDEDPFCRLLDYTEDEVVYYTRNHRNHFSPALTMHKSFETIQYLDLDHPETTGLQQPVPKSPDRSQASGIVYKTVDFVKTEAFQRTKQEVEKVRKCT